MYSSVEHEKTFSAFFILHSAKTHNTLGGGLVSYLVPDKANKGASFINLEKDKTKFKI